LPSNTYALIKDHSLVPMHRNRRIEKVFLKRKRFGSHSHKQVEKRSKMKVSAAAVLLTISSASAFNVGYLNQLGSGTAAGIPAPAVKEVVSSGHSYLDNLGGATPELVSAIEAAPAPVAAAPAPVAAAPAPVAAAPAAAAAPTSTDYLSGLPANGATEGAGLTGYLDALPPSAVGISGAGLTGYLDALPSASAPITGSGFITHLDSISPAAAAPAPVAAAPAPVAAAPAAAAPAPVAAAPVVAAPAAGDYLSHLASDVSLGGAGLTTHVDTLSSNTAPSGSGAAFQGYLGALGASAAAISGAGMTGYLDALKTNEVVGATATTTSGGASVTAFLENVYSQILSLPDGPNKQTVGDSVTFSSVEGPYAMSFAKN
jgi:hypothetical protein